MNADDADLICVIRVHLRLILYPKRLIRTPSQPFPPFALNTTQLLRVLHTYL